jgi:hypothetical protein
MCHRSTRPEVPGLPQSNGHRFLVQLRPRT